MNPYECELCGTDRKSYAAMMQCEADCERENRDARRNHTSPRIMRPMREWWED